MAKNKKNLRILPFFIFLAVLTLSIKINNVFDLLKHPENNTISIMHPSAFAQDSQAQKTDELEKVLNSGNTQANTPPNSTRPDNGFSQSEILILQELAERREALDLRSKEIDRKAVQLKVAEDEIDKKIKQLQDYEQRLKKLMTQYNQAEKEKIYSNINAIKEYIANNIQPHITDCITVDFGEMKTYYHGDREKEFHLYVRPDSISGRSGGLGLEFDADYESSSLTSTVYKHMDYAIALLKNWKSIKATLNTSIAHEKATREMINSFEV